MTNSSDITFITNEPNKKLADRFETLLPDTKFFDVLVGYFYTSGFHRLHQHLQKTQKIRILIGIKTDQKVIDAITSYQQERLPDSSTQTTEAYKEQLRKEFENSEDTQQTEDNANLFKKWVAEQKIELRAYSTANLHAKLYIMSFADDDRDKGRVITGSSNFTSAGLEHNLEFNLELKNSSDYHFAKEKFEELWEDGVDLSAEYKATLEADTWLKKITPYELYLKFLYEHFQAKLNQTETATELPSGIKNLAYQQEAVQSAQKILLEYGGVFISDVVGLGKTYIAAMLAHQIGGRTLIIAPPILLESNNPGSWANVFMELNLPFYSLSAGSILNFEKHLGDTDGYKNIIIDESHKFRKQENKTYASLAKLCRGKRIILVSATPYNNRPEDILSQLKLFQDSKNSTIPGVRDLEYFFAKFDFVLKKFDRKKHYNQYIQAVKENSQTIRNKLLKYLMVRRTRQEIQQYFQQDLIKEKLTFPEIKKPTACYYQLNEQENHIFEDTIKQLVKNCSYARYTPLSYHLDPTIAETHYAFNLVALMKVLLVKRLESSFYAFKKSIARFLKSYCRFLEEIEGGTVYVSKQANKLFDLIEQDKYEEVEKMLTKGKAVAFPSKDFKPELKKHLKADIQILEQIQKNWETLKRDPKLSELQKQLQENPILQEKIIIFTESNDTAHYLAENLDQEKVLLFTGKTREKNKDLVLKNFDPNLKADHQANDYHILLATEILSEGVNLHRSNVIINYDIPWNPTRMMQRVGRVNRINTSFLNIHTFNFFPSEQVNDQIKLKELAQAKINGFFELLGADAATLTENEPIGSHELFEKLFSKSSLEAEAEPESDLKYLLVIKNIRDENPALFNKIKNLPKKSRSAKPSPNAEALLTYFRKGGLEKFFLAASKTASQELDFMEAAKLLESDPKLTALPLSPQFYELLEKNKKEFGQLLYPQQPPVAIATQKVTPIQKIIKLTLKQTEKLTEKQVQKLETIQKRITEGGIPKNTLLTCQKELGNLQASSYPPLQVLATLQKHITDELLRPQYATQKKHSNKKAEVVLSLYLKA